MFGGQIGTCGRRAHLLASNMRSQANAYGAPDGDDNSRGAQLAAKFNQRYQFYLDKSVPHLQQRWAAWGGVALIYLIRISFLKDGTS